MLEAGPWVRVLEKEAVSVPETVAHLRAEAFMDSTLHTALHRSPKGLPPLAQHLCLQAVLPLADNRPGGGPCLDFDAPVGCQLVLLPVAEHGADAAGEAAHGQGDLRDGKHQTARFRPAPDALGPEVRSGKGTPSVRLDIPKTFGKVQALPVQFQGAAQGMSHADDTVSTLHSPEKPKGPHDVGAQGGEGAIAQGTAERQVVPLDAEVDPLVVKAGLPEPYLKGTPGYVQLFRRVFQPPRLIV